MLIVKLIKYCFVSVNIHGYLFVVICFAYVHILFTYLILEQGPVQNHHFCGCQELLNDY